MPKISIGLPVYNGERYLSEAISSILNQTYKNFELIISDNASTDSTKEICESFSKKDKRIKYYRAEHNKGAAWNFNNTFHFSSGEYFKWAAHDDIIAPDFLHRCTQIMDEDPSIVLCHSEIQIIDDNSEVIKGHQHSSENINQYLKNIGRYEPHLRFNDLIQYAHPCIEIFGLLRRDILSRSPLIAGYIGSDRNLLAELALRGRFYRIPELLFYSRMHDDRSIKIENKISLRRWFNPKDKSTVVFPSWKNGYEYLKTIKRAPISLKQKLNCCFHLFRWAYTYRRRFFYDVKLALKSVSPKWFLDFYQISKKQTKRL